MLAAATTTAPAQERIALTSAESAPSVQTYRLESFRFVEDDPATVSTDEGALTFQLIGVERRVTIACSYTSATNPTGTFLITALQKANLSSAYAGNATTGSLKQRIFHRLVIMDEASAVCGRSIVGTLTGSPQ